MACTDKNAESVVGIAMLLPCSHPVRFEPHDVGRTPPRPTDGSARYVIEAEREVEV